MDFLDELENTEQNNIDETEHDEFLDFLDKHTEDVSSQSNNQEQQTDIDKTDSNIDKKSNGNSNNSNYDNRNKMNKRFGHSYTFYTNNNAFCIKMNSNGIYFEIAPVNNNGRNNRTYDWKNKIVVKMNIEEVSMIIDCLERYMLYGKKGFDYAVTFYSGDNKQNNNNLNISFYHESNNNKTVITLYLNKYELPCFYIIKNKENKFHFSILKSQISAFIKVLDTYLKKYILSI